MSPKQIRFPDGVLLIDKPSGCTSFDVVKRIKKLVGKQKVGHTGTLDPLATGLLPVCIGEATKIASLLTGQKKRYRARLRMGTATDTLDREGKVTETRPVPGFDRQTIDRCLEEFTGTIEQVPPMYSAVHHQGKRLYQLAREGVEVERKSRRVEIMRIGLEDAGVDFLVLDVVCKSGTYIRSLVVDIANCLGTVGHLEELSRTETAGWKLDQACRLERLDSKTMVKRIIPVHRALERFLRVPVSDEVARRLSEGRRLSVSELQSLGINDEIGSEPFWFCGPLPSPLILARLDPRSKETGTRMEIVRVLFPGEKNV